MFKSKVFDSADYESRLACNHELMALVANEFISEASGLFERFQSSIASEDWENTLLIAQRLRGASLEVSGYQFCQRISEVEALLKEEKDLLPTPLISDLTNEFQHLVSALKQEVLL